MRPVSWNLTASRAPSQTAANLLPVRCCPKPASSQPPAASQPAPKEQWLGLGPVSLHIRSRWYINGYKWHMPGNCLVKQLQPDPAREKRCEEKKTNQHLSLEEACFCKCSCRDPHISLLISALFVAKSLWTTPLFVQKSL